MTRVLSVLKWFVVLLLVFGVAFVIFVFVKIQQPLAAKGESVKFTVAPGQTTKQVAANLASQKLVGRALYFELYFYLNKQDSKIQAGTYQLSSSMSVREIADYMLSGKVIPETTKLTVIEGWTVSDIAKELADENVMPKKVFIDLAGKNGKNFSDEFDFLKSKPATAGLEGFLFPDTYFLAKSTTPEDAVRKMLDNFGKKVPKGLTYDDLILASIIEKEVGRNIASGGKLSAADMQKLKDERRLVSSVFHNRMEAGMALESDATLQYVTNSNSASATLDELKIDSPYNTYKYKGLPPTPISNPSLDSILAAMEPAKSDYLFFLNAPDGTAHFAITLDQHNANKAKYLK